MGELKYLCGYSGYTEKIKRTIDSIANSFCYIGFMLWEVREHKHYKENGYNNVVEYAEKELQFKKSTTYSLIKVCEKFSKYKEGRPTMYLDDNYKCFSFTQLVEMTSIKDIDKLELIESEMSVKEIRQVKNQKVQSTGKNEVEFKEKEVEKVQSTGKSEKQLMINDDSSIIEVDFIESIVDVSEEVQPAGKVLIDKNQAEFICKFINYYRGNCEKWYVEECNKEKVQAYIHNLLIHLGDKFLNDIRAEKHEDVEKDILPYLKSCVSKRGME